MQKPIITLKSLKYLASLSEETPAYTATICVNGIPFCHVRNSGHGGGDNYDPLKTTKHNDMWGEVKELDGLIAATYPIRNAWGMELKETLESLCHGLVYDAMEEKTLKGLLSRKVVMFTPEKTVVTLNGKKTPDAIAYAAKKWPNNIIMNNLVFDEALKLYKTH